MTPRRPEARLEKEILLALGADPAIALYTNPVGEGYYAAVLPQIRTLLRGSPQLDAVMQVLYRSRVVYGLGVGSPDIVGIGYGGVFIGPELKAGTRPSPEQLQWHAAARARGARVGVVESVDDAWALARGVVG